jgi:hypothetical protein
VKGSGPIDAGTDRYLLTGRWPASCLTHAGFIRIGQGFRGKIAASALIRVNGDRFAELPDSRRT